MEVAGVANSAESFVVGWEYVRVLFILIAATGCKLNSMRVLDGALQEELAVHRLTRRLCGLMNGGE